MLEYHFYSVSNSMVDCLPNFKNIWLDLLQIFVEKIYPPTVQFCLLWSGKDMTSSEHQKRKCEARTTWKTPPEARTKSTSPAGLVNSKLLNHILFPPPVYSGLQVFYTQTTQYWKLQCTLQWETMTQAMSILNSIASCLEHKVIQHKRWITLHLADNK